MYIVKCILIGTSHIGKSSLFLRFLHNKYISDYQATIGVDFGEKTVLHNNEEYKIQIWDTAGQERFESVTTAFYRNTNCVLFCFSLADRESFVNAQRYIDLFRHLTPETANVMEILVGLCSDLPNIVTTGEIEKMKKDNDIDIYYSISSKNNTNVNQLFNIIVNNAHKYCVKKQNIQHKYIEQMEVIDVNQKKDNESCCESSYTHYNPYHFPHPYYI